MIDFQKCCKLIVYTLGLYILIPFYSLAQGVSTYINPVLAGDHPDQTILRIGNDFYSTGSSFDFTPNVPILHSKDLVHWETISRAVPANWSGLTNDVPGGGCWQGSLAFFNNSYWVYFSTNYQQYFCTASSPYGPWSAPVQVQTTSTTGPIGYDNSIFVDDDGTPYMLMKPSQYVNKIQQVGMNGHLTGTMIDISWINPTGQYAWAEGPVMCKRNGWYYYIFAGNVSGGQYTYRTQSLSAPQSSWQFLGNFFAPITDNSTGFKGPNHVSQPVQIQDGTWWALSHSYNNINGNDWSGQGRQGLLHQVIWDASGTPSGTAPTTSPLAAPALTDGGIPMNLPRNDNFNSTTLGLHWHFLGKVPCTQYSLSARPGWMRINPGNGISDVLQKDAGQYYTLVTKLDFTAQTAGQEAGIRIVNGEGKLSAKLCSGFNNGAKIQFSFNATSYELTNSIGSIIWLKLQRQGHILSGFVSADKILWTQVGAKIDVSALDQGQPNFNGWVGNSIGLFANNKSADFDDFVYKDGFSPIYAAGFNNQYGIQIATDSLGASVGYIDNGDWIMLGGIDLGDPSTPAKGIEVKAASGNSGGSVEVWLDNIGSGTLLTTVSIAGTSGWSSWKIFGANLSASGQHDVYLKFVGGFGGLFNINYIQFMTTSECASSITQTSPVTFCAGGNVVLTANSGSSYAWYNGTTQVGTTSTFTASASGSYSVQVTNTLGCKAISAAKVITVNPIPVITMYENINGKGWQSWSSATVCNGSSVLFGPWPTVANGWSWTGPNSFSATQRDPSVVVSGLKQSGIYSVVYTDANGCQGKSSFNLSVSVPIASISTSNTSICQGSSTLLSANVSSGYQWLNGTTLIGTSSTYTANTSGSYRAVITNTDGCIDTSTATVITIKMLPPAPSVTSPISYCQNATATALSATGTSLAWYSSSTGGTANTIAPIPSTASAGTTNYYVSQTTNNCEGPRAAIAVTVNALPLPTISSNPTMPLCTISSAVLSTGTASTYSWMNGTTPVATSPSYKTANPGSYTVMITNALGCTGKSAPFVFSTANQNCYDCANVLNGTATIDNCGKCTGGTTGLKPCIITAVSISFPLSTGVLVYPQPFNISTNVQLKNGENIDRLVVYNSLGVLVYEKSNIVTSEITIGENLMDGLYLVIIHTRYNVFTAKIIKNTY
jgi:beta-xylosidase